MNEARAGKRSVFVIDDAPDIRLLYRLSFERSTFQLVGEAATGAEALAQVVVANPDIVLIDLVLPDMSGVDVVSALRRLVPTAQLIVCSGMDEPDTEEICRAAGADAFLDKRFASDVAGALEPLLAQQGS